MHVCVLSHYTPVLTCHKRRHNEDPLWCSQPFGLEFRESFSRGRYTVQPQCQPSGTGTFFASACTTPPRI